MELLALGLGITAVLVSLGLIGIGHGGKLAPTTPTPEETAFIQAHGPSGLAELKDALGLWAANEHAAPIVGYPTISDLLSPIDARFRQMLSSFQLWANAHGPVHAIRTDGVFDSATEAVLVSWVKHWSDARPASPPIPPAMWTIITPASAGVTSGLPAAALKASAAVGDQVTVVVEGPTPLAPSNRKPRLLAIGDIVEVTFAAVPGGVAKPSAYAIHVVTTILNADAIESSIDGGAIVGSVYLVPVDYIVRYTLRPLAS
jgi:hypothetical protein